MELSKISTQDLLNEISRRDKCHKMPKKNIILLGPPGSGKGTQSIKLLNDFCYCQLSTGDLLRENVSRKTPAGIKAKEAMDKGQLVSDEIVNEILVNAMKSPMCERGIIFDGYPRNPEQAENLNNLLTSIGKKLDKVIELKIDPQELFERVEGRRVHTQSGRTYHVKFNPPKIEGIDDVTGEALIHRDDDKREVLQSRLDVYNKKTAPVSDYYKNHNVLTPILAKGRIDDIYSQIKSSLL
jgi:adenylate kinase